MPVPGRNGVTMPVPGRNGVTMPVLGRNGVTMPVLGRNVVTMSGPGRSALAIPGVVEMELQWAVMTTFVTLYTDPSKGREIWYVNYECKNIISNNTVIVQCFESRITNNRFVFEQKIDLRTIYFSLNRK